MYIRTVPELLAWRDDTLSSVIQQRYVKLLAKRLGEAVARDQEYRSHLLNVVSVANERSILRVLTAPEMSWRLLWPQRRRSESSIEFFARSVEREEARIGRGRPAAQASGWGALGDFRIDALGQIHRGPVLDGMMPLDIVSPFAAKADLGGAPEVNALPRPPFSDEEAAATFRLCREAGSLIALTNCVTFDFAMSFTKVLILQKHPFEDSFSSGTTAQYIGRSVIVNPHRISVTQFDVADAIVHEAIHAVLFMEEQSRAWVSEVLYDSTPRVESPWSGRVLPLRAFLQACFVWFGLLNFWSDAALALPHDPAVRQKLAQAAVGFLGGSLSSRVQDFSEGIDRELLSTIDRMGERATLALRRVL